MFVTHLARSIPGLGCLKVRPAHNRLGEDQVGERTVDEDFYLEDLTCLDSAGGDTALYLQAGAMQVEILRHRETGLPAGLEAAFHQFPFAMPIVVESSSAVRLLRPVAVVLIIHPPVREMKPSTDAILSRVTDLLINASDRDQPATKAAERLWRQYPLLRPRYTWSADLISEPPPGEMLARLRTLLTTDAHP